MLIIKRLSKFYEQKKRNGANDDYIFIGEDKFFILGIEDS